MIPLGFAVLDVFFGFGLYLPLASRRYFRRRPKPAHTLGLILSLVAMPFVWPVGFWVFFFGFALPC